jgi:hypothetical protein
MNNLIRTLGSVVNICLDSKKVGPGSSGSIATELQAGRSEDRIPVGVRFFAHIQTGPKAHPAFCTMGIGSFPRVKQAGRGADHPPPSTAKVENE